MKCYIGYCAWKSRKGPYESIYPTGLIHPNWLKVSKPTLLHDLNWAIGNRKVVRASRSTIAAAKGNDKCESQKNGDKTKGFAIHNITDYWICLQSTETGVKLTTSWPTKVTSFLVHFPYSKDPKRQIYDFNSNFYPKIDTFKQTSVDS